MKIGCRFCGCPPLKGFVKSYHEFYKTDEDNDSSDWHTRVGDLSYMTVCKRCLKEHTLDELLSNDPEITRYPLPRPLTKGEFVRLFRAKSKIDRGFDSAAWLKAHDLAEEDFQSKSLLLRLLTFGWL